VGLGFHPFATREDLPRVPKLRYAMMEDYLPTRGRLAIDMMLRTATVQANYDYESEEDALRKLRLSLRIQPIVTAMFANSPWVEGEATGERSHRARVWLEMDPDRSGLLPFAWHEARSFRDYVEWALDVPMFLIKRGNRVRRNTGQTFRAFLRDGLDGERATDADWQTHLNTLFPEVRLKRTLEVRGADGQGTPLTCALPALFKGLLYDREALDALEALTTNLDFDTVQAARADIAGRALRAKLGRRDVAEWANDLLDVAERGLARQARTNRQGEDERVHLRRLRELAAAAQCPADVLLDDVGAGAGFHERVLNEARVE
jgi:glutamate--cysteine ligase